VLDDSSIFLKDLKIMSNIKKEDSILNEVKSEVEEIFINQNDIKLLYNIINFNNEDINIHNFLCCESKEELENLEIINRCSLILDQNNINSDLYPENRDDIVNAIMTQFHNSNYATDNINKILNIFLKHLIIIRINQFHELNNDNGNYATNNVKKY